LAVTGSLHDRERLRRIEALTDAELSQLDAPPPFWKRSSTG
jgi:hypothetical protein